MTKLYKNIILSVLTAIAFAFAGLFFVGCNKVDYSDVTIASNISSINLQVGESQNVTFTIENATDSFYKVLRFSVDNESVVKISSVKYDDNVATVSIEGLAGGSVNLMATSEEGYKWTTIRINVIEHSSSLSFDGSKLYLTSGSEISEASALKLTSSNYIFDANTTDKALTFYYLYKSENADPVNIETLTFKGFASGTDFDFSDVNNIGMPSEPTLEFEGENTVEYNLNALRFDRAEIVNGVLNLYYNGEIVANSDANSELHLSSLSDALRTQKFHIITFYNYSVYENSTLSVKNYLHYMHEVEIYQNLGVKVYGGYLKPGVTGVDENRWTVDFSSEYDVDSKIKIVTNNKDYSTYILKVTTAVEIEDLEFGVGNVGEFLSIETYTREAWEKLRDNLDIGEFNSSTATDNVFYIMINTSSFANSEQNFDIFVRYEGMESVENDFNVNFNPEIAVDVNLVTTEILINDISATSYSSVENPILIYNFYRYPEFGWRELRLSLSTGLDAEAVYSYATISFDSEIIDFKQGTNGEVVDDGKIFDISTSFFYRGRTDATESLNNKFTITIYYLIKENSLDENSNELITVSCDVYFDIIAGANSITRDERYGAGGEVIYIDMQSEGTTSLGDYLHTKNAFQAVTVSHASGENVVSFIVDEDCCLPKYDVNNQELLYYALNLSVSPIKTGTGMYRVMLDNGVFVSVTINVINTLQTDNFGVELVSSDYVGYYEYKTTRFDEEATETYTNTLLLEILNNTDDSDNTYSVVYGSEVGIKFYGNILSNPIYTLEYGNVLSVGSNGDLSYVITTSENGEALVTFEVDGYEVDGLLNRDTMSVNYYIEAKSYSLLDEFYLMNEGRYAVDNIVYYGQNQNSNLPPEATSVTFEVYAENTEAFGFYKYKISDNFIQDIIDSIEINGGELSSSNANGLAIAQLIQELIEAGEAGVTNPIVEEENPIILEVDESYVTSELQYKKYDRDYIYFYADANSRSLTTYAIAQIKITPSAEGLTSTYPLYLEFDNGIMFDLEDITTTYRYGDIDYTIIIDFSNTYSLSGDFGPQGEFDFSTFTYTQTAAVNSDFVLHSYIRQRNYTEMQYDANIVTSEYIEIERVSTASSIDEIAFTNGYLSDTFVVFVSPTDATNIDLKAQFVSTNQISRDLITTNIVEQGVGVYLVEISVEDFYNANSAIINTIETALSGTLYIYPTEWGEDHSVLGEHTPIKIAISYRNGSEANRYILDSPEDVLAINNNEETLSSHYEIRTNIDMSTVKGETIGFVINADGSRQLIGFSGSIVGTTSQAGISNFKLTMIPSKDNGSISALTPGENSSYYYAGLFAQINHDGYIKNLTISGVMDMNTKGYENPNFYIGLLAGVNYGKISNVSAVVSGASEVLVCNSGEFCIGGLVGLNGVINYDVNEHKAGEIVQNFNSYVDKESEEEEEVKFTIEDKVGEFAGQSPKNIANFNAKLTITLDGTATSASVYAGGIAGLSRGDIYRIDNSGLNIYGYASYSSFTNIEVDGGKAKEIFAGGAVGYLQAEGNVTSNIIKTTIEDFGGTFYVNANPIEFNDNALPRVTLFNLLVGGEVDVKNSADSVAVGGIVGYAGESGQQSYILGNISRTFVRGGVNTGGIVGVENNNGVNVNYLLHKTDENGMFVQTDESSRVVLENTINKIEAVDDGRGAFDSSMMLLSGTTDKFEDNILNPDHGVTKDVIVAIGNSYDNGRSYKSDGIVYALFDICSYVDRGLNENVEINKNDNSLTSYYGDYLMYNGSSKVEQFEFNKAEANLGIQDSIYAMKSKSGKENVFVMFNFNGMLTDDAEGVAQDYIDASNINKFAPNSSLYPFALDTRDAQILSTSTNLLKVDADGSLTTYSKGLASVNLQSILNVQKSINIYLYIVNYMDTQSENSIFYSSNTTDSLNIISGSQVVVYGTRQTSVYAVPTYYLGEGNLSYEVANGERRDVIIKNDGTFLLNNVGIRLNTNDSVVVDATCENPLYTTYDVNGQSILFYGKGDNLQGTDTYNLTSYLETTVGDDVYRLAIGASRNTENPGVDINVEYKETATGINVSSNLISMKTNDVYNEKIYVTSRNNEFVYYEIFFTDNDNNEYKIQERMSNSWAGNIIEDELDDSEYKKYVLSYENYIKNGENEYNENLFNLVIDKDDVNRNNNEFSFAISVNKNSSMYLNRKNVNIYGTYRIVFYANEMYDGVHTNFIFYLSEAEITNVDAVNYSKMTDMSVRDDNIVPSQYGLLEINIDPIEAEFNTFKIENDSINYLEGAGEVDFTFMYQSTTDGVIRYLPDVNFGLNINGSLSFSYEEYIDYLDAKGESYNGKIYVRYLLGSLGVQDEMPIRFNIEVSYLSGQVEYEEVNLTTKLAHYAHLSFNDREESDIYYVARGLDYEMTLDFYGFGLNDISITMSDGSIATLVGEGRERSLKITDSVITPTDDIGYKLNIYVNASRVVDNVTVQYSEILTVYIMEFVFDYQYVIGQNEDLVRGMEEGVISTAVGNAYSLEVDIWDFLEYDDTNNSVIRNVQEFINSLTSNAEFKIYDASSGRDGLLLSSDTNIRSDYYYINGLTFTGIRLYEPEQDIYHFSMEAKFVRRNGLYVVDDDALDSQTIYTEFSFYIHQQSTDESPLPIETYEEFMNMEDGQYYILLNDIVLPNSDTAQPFTPITANVAGFDGNGYSLLLGGNYTFSGSNIGVFETIGATNDDVVVKNLTVELYLNTIFTVTSGNFTLGLIAGGNNAVITNCEVITNNNSALSVSCSASSSFVAGFVGRNSGIITNSRSSVSIFTNVNLSGFVGTNTGTISSSYFHKGSLRNETTTTSEYTAGFAINNSGTINTSYVSGEVNDNEEVYSRDENSFITSHNAISGFVFTNSGIVTNCYSNIYMNNTSSYASGFVFINESGGEVSSSFSTSVLASNSTLSYGFARANSGSIHDAYYLKDKNINESVGTVENGPNTSIEDLTIDEFSSGDENFAEHFQNFVFVNSRGYNAVWFYNNTNTSAYYNGQNFNLNRLELVAPNILAFSQRYLYSAEEVVDPETGVTTVVYHYVNTAESGESGSINNPIVLDNAENFENYILNENNNNHYNHSYYRVINNIDYSEYDNNSELFKTRFMGYFEGNFLTISNVHMVTSERLLYAGFFAEVGSSTREGAIGTVMNFNLEPSEMVFTNTQVSGGIAGRVDSGVIANINIVSDDNIMVTANNIAGGIVGLAVGNYDIENVNSDASAKATYIPENGSSNTFNESSTDFSRNSYAGSVVGVASGNGSVNKVNVNSGVAVIGGTSGAIIGMLSREARASNLTLTVDTDLMINAYYYGGLVIGESAGMVDNVSVIGTGLYETIFNNIPNDPVAVGGVVGLMSNGSLNNVEANQSLSLSVATNTSGVSYLGGLIGSVAGSVDISNVDVQGSYIGFSVVGGLIGGVTEDNVVVNLKNISYTDGYLAVLSTQQSNASIGGVIGSATDSASINITAELSSSLKTNLTAYANTLMRENDADNTYLEFTEVLNAGENYALSTDMFTNDDRTALNSQYVSEANKIEFEAHALAYVYGTILDIYLGEIIGNTLSSMVNVNNTISVMTANIESYNMGCVNPGTYTESAYITQGTYNYKLHTNSETLDGTGYIFTDYLDFSSTASESNVGHIIQDIETTYIPSTAVAGEEEGTVITTNSFGANFGDDFYVLPIYSHNVSYTFYMEGGESDHNLHLTNYGMGVSANFTTL